MISEWYLNYILDSLYLSVVLNGILNLPLTVQPSPTEIPLNGPMNDTEWYSVVYHWLFFVSVAYLNAWRVGGFVYSTTCQCNSTLCNTTFYCKEKYNNHVSYITHMLTFIHYS